MEQNNFENILNESMDRVLAGEPVEQVLAVYPEHAIELEPLLKTVVSAGVIQGIKPRPEFKSVAAAEFQSAARDLEDKKLHPGFFSRWYHSWKFGWSVASVSLLVVVMTLAGVVLAASDSMPDEGLYTVKLATEQVHMAVTVSEVDKAELNASYAERRIDELVYMAEKEDTDGVLLVASNLNSNLRYVNAVIDEEIASNMSSSLMSTSTSAGGGESESMLAAPGVDDAQKSLAAPDRAASPAPGDGITSAAVPEADIAAQKSLEVNTFSAAGEDNGLAVSAESVVVPEEYAELEKLIQKYIKRQERLEILLKEASPGIRPAIKLAIAQSVAEYEEALRNLELLARMTE